MMTPDEPSAAGLYGVMAIVLHTNQLAVPLLWAWLLRSHMYAALGQTKQTGSVAPLPEVMPTPSAGGSADGAPANPRTV